MAKYRTKVVEVDAWQMPKGADFTVPRWLSVAFEYGSAWWSGGENGRITVEALPCDLVATAGDWIVQHRGRLLVLGTQEFEARYERATKTPAGGDGRPDEGE